MFGLNRYRFMFPGLPLVIQLRAATIQVLDKQVQDKGQAALLFR
ncbi:hypothetical protein V6C53_11050 [Desulfocurvibacter africanus]